MNRRKADLLDLRLKYSNDKITAAINIVGEYLKIYDMEKGTYCYEIFKDLFIENKKTYREIAEENYVSESSLRRCVNRFIWLIEKLI